MTSKLAVVFFLLIEAYESIYQTHNVVFKNKNLKIKL